MAIDERYQDNLVVTKDAFQNLLTNIKNYPIVDIDYITETDLDELHGDTIWENYTSGIPCIKITYGDDRATKGNIIFAEDQRVKINKYKKILNQLTVWLNENERLYSRWQKIYELNYRIYEEKTDQIDRFFARFASIETNKLAFLKAGWNLLQYNLVDLFNPEINDDRETTLLRVSDPQKFQYQEFLGPDNFDYKKALIPQNGNTQVVNNLEYIVLNEEQKAKITTTLYLLRDTLVGDDDNATYFFTEKERAAINSFINFIASYNYFSVLEAVGLAGYNYTSDQILIIKQGKIQINNSNRVATFDKVSENATFREGTNYYSPAYYPIYVNVGNNGEYNANTSYYMINNNPNNNSTFYTPYTYTTQADFDSKKHLLYTKQQNLLCYQLVENLNATTFENQKDNLYIQSSNGELIEQAVRNILPQIVDDLVWENLDNINLSFDSVFFDFSSNIQNIINTMNQAVGPRLTYILQHLDYYGTNILLARSFKIINNTITISENEETVYASSPNTEDDTIADHLLDEIVAIKFKIEIVNELIRKCNQLIQDIATGKKNAAGEDIEEGTNRILYGYKYVKVGSNIIFDDTYYDDNSPYDVGKGKTAEKLEIAVNSAQQEAGTLSQGQASGTFRITINKHIYEVPIKGFTDVPSNQPIYITTNNDTGVTITSKNGATLKPITLNGNVTDKGTLTVNGASNLDSTLSVTGATTLSSTLSVTGATTLSSTLSVTGATTLSSTLSVSNNITTGGDITPTGNGVKDLGSTSNYWDDGFINHINIHGNDNKAGPSGSTIAGDTGYFNNIYINGNSINTTKLNSAINGISDTTKFWRGDADWSDTLTGQFKLTRTTGDNNTTVPTASTASLVVSGSGYFGYNLTANKVYGAVFNDYAECRTTIDLAPGHVVIDQDDGSLTCSFKRLQPGAQVISDTYGHLMGATDKATTPIAVAGRVLVYTYQPRENYHAGMAVCSAPDGTVDIMTREEIRDYPDCIIGIVSEIPSYDIWGSDNVKVDGRIWIKVK